jgi:Ca2+-binding RTX toxin-like protein
VSFKDLNHDGVFQPGAGETTELKTLDELGITSIRLRPHFESGLVNGGNRVLDTSTFTMVGGVTRDMQAVQFLADPEGHTFADRVVNGIKTGTFILTEGGTSSYVSYAPAGEAMSTTSLGVQNLYGGAGTDTLTGDAGANWLAGGAGSDRFDAGHGDDTLLIDAADLQQNIHAGAGNDIAQVIGAEGVTLNMAQAEVEIVQGGDGNDVFIGGGRASVFARGGAGDDLIIGGAANDALSGEDGDDLIDGGQGNDLIRGHRGHDVLFGGTGDDVIEGGQDDDRIAGGAGNDVMRGDQGDDAIDGGDGVDIAEYTGVVCRLQHHAHGCEHVQRGRYQGRAGRGRYAHVNREA